jgi:hypothetical protein
MSKPYYTVDEVIEAAKYVIAGNENALQTGKISAEAKSGALAGILAVLITLDIDVVFGDGTKWVRGEGGIPEQVPDDFNPPKPGREKLN